MYRLLLIDDDARSCEMLSDFFGAQEFEAVFVHHGREALGAVLASAGNTFDLILLATELSGLDGIDVLRTLRSRRSTPVILLASSTRVGDCVVGLETGADDYMIKPIDPLELLARVRAVLRRAQRLSECRLQGPDRIVVADIELDPGSRLVRRNGEKLRLTSAEFGCLEALLKEAGQVVSRDRLARSALGRDLGAGDRSVDMHVSRLRKKLGPVHNGIERIKTVRGAGFVYTIPNPFEFLHRNTRSCAPNAAGEGSPRPCPNTSAAMQPTDQE
ncbi:MAG: response regulator transcription factor [Syntrophobacteraceae bacterium]|nr:response regulator transcription factor [Syntrophobacteraceae bacterium]